MELSRYRFIDPEAFVSHASATLTPITRLRLVTDRRKTTPQLVRAIVGLRWRHRLGPVQIAGRLAMAASTVHAVLVRSWLRKGFRP